VSWIAMLALARLAQYITIYEASPLVYSRNNIEIEAKDEGLLRKELFYTFIFSNFYPFKFIYIIFNVLNVEFYITSNAIFNVISI